MDQQSTEPVEKSPEPKVEAKAEKKPVLPREKRRELEDQIKQLGRDAQDIGHKTKAAVEKLEQDHRANRSKVERNLLAKIKPLDEEKRRAIAAAESTRDKETKRLRDQRDKAIKDLKAEWSGKIQEAEQAAERQIEAARQRFTKDSGMLEQEIKASTKELDDQHRQEVVALIDAKNKKIEAIDAKTKELSDRLGGA